MRSCWQVLVSLQLASSNGAGNVQTPVTRHHGHRRTEEVAVRRVLIALGGAMVVISAVAGCASAGGHAEDGSRNAFLSQADQGRRISVPTGSTVTVRLDNTYWRFQPPSSRALRLLGVDAHPGSGGVPGSGKGTVVARYRAVAPGQAVVSASRTVCGEALRCSAGQSHFRVTLVVKR
jgi:hypothetical protein